MSNETPSPSPKKTKSGLKYALVAVAAIIVSIGLAQIRPNEPSGPSVELGGKLFDADVVDTDDERVQGLSGRENLARNEGMLFVFDEPGKYCFWMKDMNFAIDMLWLDGSGKVVHMAENATPDSYPQQFCPDTEASYVFEVNAGVAGALGLDIGSQAEIHR